MSWRRDRLPPPVFLGFPCGSAGKESACNAGDLGLIPGLGRSPGEGKGYPLQYSCLGNSMDCVAHRVAKRHDWESFTHSLLTISGSSMSPWLQISSSFSGINEVNFSPNGCFIECHSVPFLPCFEMLVFKVYLKWQVFFFCLMSLLPLPMGSCLYIPATPVALVQTMLMLSSQVSCPSETCLLVIITRGLQPCPRSWL